MTEQETTGNKSYLIISPQVWGDIYISKHNYALALLEMGHTVYFLNPPTYTKKLIAINLSIKEKFPNLFVISYELSNFIHRLRFKARPAYDFVMRSSLIKQLNAIKYFDEVWCFEPNIFSSFQKFNAGKKLLFIVDHHDNNNLKKLAATTNGIATVSPVIMDYFSFSNKPKLLINHGLNKTFSELAFKKLESELTAKPNVPIVVAYVGNLLMGNRIDIKTIQAIVEKYPAISFQFFGPYLEKNNTLVSTVDGNVKAFISFLKDQPNVILHGVISQNELAAKIQEVDAFLISYDYLNDINKSSNCHKIIEYLSTGKVVVANRIMSYENTEGLLEMPAEYTNENLPAVFDTVVSGIEHYNSSKAQKARIQFALQNTYSKHINTIKNFVAEI